MITKEQIGKRIREMRKQANLSQKEVGKLIDRTHATISDIERGRTELSLTDLSKLADKLGFSLASFFSLERPISKITWSIGNLVLDSTGKHIIEWNGI